MSEKMKYDAKFFYVFDKKRFEIQSELPDSACSPGKHKWESDYSFGKWRCSICGAYKERRPTVDEVLKKKLLESKKGVHVSPSFSKVIKSVEKFQPSRVYKNEFPYQTELQGWLKHEFPTSSIEKTTGASRPDIIIDDIAIEVKGPTKNGDLVTLSEKCLKYLTHYKHLIIALFEPQFSEGRYLEIEKGIKQNLPQVRIIRK